MTEAQVEGRACELLRYLAKHARAGKLEWLVGVWLERYDVQDGLAIVAALPRMYRQCAEQKARSIGLFERRRIAALERLARTKWGSCC